MAPGKISFKLTRSPSLNKVFELNRIGGRMIDKLTFAFTFLLTVFYYVISYLQGMIYNQELISHPGT